MVFASWAMFGSRWPDGAVPEWVAVRARDYKRLQIIGKWGRGTIVSQDNASPGTYFIHLLPPPSSSV